MADKKKVTITVTILPAERKAMKIYAAERDVSLSDLLSEWINEHCIKKEGDKNE